VYLDTSDNIRKFGSWRIDPIWCIWRFLNNNNELASTISLWTADLSSGFIPDTLRIVSSSNNSYVFQACLELDPPWPCVTLLPWFPVIPPNFVIYLPLYTSLYIPNFTSSNMEPTTSQVRNHYSEENQEAHLGRALVCPFRKRANRNCQSNVWSSNPAFEYSVGNC